MTDPLADPERELALSYAKPLRREHLRALWKLDERFGAIVAGTTEPAIGEMRLLWWREALEAVGDDAPAEPLLQDIRAVLSAIGSDGTEWGAMAEGWHALLQEPVRATEIDRFARERGGRLFRLSARLLGESQPIDVEEAGRGWALVDVACHISDKSLSGLAFEGAENAFAGMRRKRWPKSLRPLGALTVLARRDARTRPSQRRQGSPARVARMAWHRLTGR